MFQNLDISIFLCIASLGIFTFRTASFYARWNARHIKLKVVGDDALRFVAKQGAAYSFWTVPEKEVPEPDRLRPFFHHSYGVS